MPTPGTNNATPPARKPAKDRKPKAAPRALSPQDALAILQSALRECQLAGIEIVGAMFDSAGYLMRLNNVGMRDNALVWLGDQKHGDNMDVKESTHGTD